MLEKHPLATSYSKASPLSLKNRSSVLAREARRGDPRPRLLFCSDKKNGGMLTLRTRRFRMASAAKTRSPTAESSIFQCPTALSVQTTNSTVCWQNQSRPLSLSPKSVTVAADSTHYTPKQEKRGALSRGRGQPPLVVLATQKVLDKKQKGQASIFRPESCSGGRSAE